MVSCITRQGRYEIGGHPVRTSRLRTFKDTILIGNEDGHGVDAGDSARASLISIGEHAIVDTVDVNPFASAEIIEILIAFDAHHTVVKAGSEDTGGLAAIGHTEHTSGHIVAVAVVEFEAAT